MHRDMEAPKKCSYALLLKLLLLLRSLLALFKDLLIALSSFGGTLALRIALDAVRDKDAVSEVIKELGSYLRCGSSLKEPRYVYM